MTWPPQRRKFRQGDGPLAPLEAASAILRGEYLMINARPIHPAVARNYSLTTIEGYSRRNRIYRAELTDAWMAANPGEPAIKEPTDE